MDNFKVSLKSDNISRKQVSVFYITKPTRK